MNRFAGRSVSAVVPAAVIVAATACTFEEGHGFATIGSARLAFFLEPGGARDLGDGAVLTDLGYHVAVRGLAVGVAAIALEEMGGGGGTAAVFDPADPPDGYTLCHGGHCHAEDGRLVDYEEIQAELAGGAATFTPIATLPVDAEIDLLAGETVTISDVLPSPELPSGTIARVTIDLDSLRLEATVTEGANEHDLGDGAVALSADLHLSSTLAVAANQPIDRDHEATFDLVVDVVADGTLFDGIDVTALHSDGRLDLAEEDPAALSLIGVLLESDVFVSF